MTTVLWILLACVAALFVGGVFVLSICKAASMGDTAAGRQEWQKGDPER